MANDLKQQIAEIQIHRNESVPNLRAHQRNLIRTLQRDLDFLFTEHKRQRVLVEDLQKELATACRHGQVLSEEVDRLTAAKKEIEEIAAGLADVAAGRTTPFDEVRKRQQEH